LAYFVCVWKGVFAASPIGKDASIRLFGQTLYFTS